MADKEYAPWSRETEDGLITSAVDSYVRVSQDIVPALAVGSIDKLSGKWEGVTVSDSLFVVDPVHAGIPNGAVVLSPQQADHEYIDMTGFRDILIAVKSNNAGNMTITAVMGPDTYPFANLSPVNAAAPLKGSEDPNLGTLEILFSQDPEALTANVWNIYSIKTKLAGQKLLQFQITNKNMGDSNIQFASMRLI